MTLLEKQVAEYVRRRAEPVSSRQLAREFLAMTVDSEALAMRLVAPLMETAGARYQQDVGWTLEHRPGSAGAREVMVAAAADPVSGEVALAGLGEEIPAGLDRCAVVMMTPAREAAVLRAWLVKKGLAQPGSIVSLRGAVRRKLAAGAGRSSMRIPRAADLPAICALLGVRWLETDDAPGAARAIAACLAALAERAARVPQDTLPSDAARGAELPTGITPEMLAALPRAPGVYRFYDDAGVILYAGKARDLRQRVSSYFTETAKRRPRRFYSRIHRFDVTPTGTEIEALMGEARLIARRQPAGNVQVEVHERPVPAAPVRACALLLPRADRRGVTALVMRDGRCLGRAVLGPKGGGLAAAKKWIGLALCAKPSKPAGNDGAESEILRSWLARHGESVCRLDLEGFRKVDAAMAALRKAVAELLAGEGGGPMVYR